MGGEIIMTPIEIAMLVQVAIKIGTEAFDFISRLSGGKIPLYAELIAMNKETQDLIDSQKE
jgi:ethanolamine utilization microcompartment shell protein EutS